MTGPGRDGATGSQSTVGEGPLGISTRHKLILQWGQAWGWEVRQVILLQARVSLPPATGSDTNLTGCESAELGGRVEKGKARLGLQRREQQTPALPESAPCQSPCRGLLFSLATIPAPSGCRPAVIRSGRSDETSQPPLPGVGSGPQLDRSAQAPPPVCLAQAVTYVRMTGLLGTASVSRGL